MKEPKTVDVGGRTYEIGRLDAITQVHLARRLAPVVLSGSFEQYGKALQEMSQENTDWIISTCLGVVKFKQVVNNHDNWSPLQKRPGVLQIGDLEGADVMELVLHVARENIGSFFDRMIGLAPASPDPTTSTS